MAQATLKDLIMDAYGQALLAASQKGLTGGEAKTAACKAAPTWFPRPPARP